MRRKSQIITAKFAENNCLSDEFGLLGVVGEVVYKEKYRYFCTKEEKMAVQTQRKLFTVNDYYKMAEVGILDWEDRVELIHGEILKMSPINSPHAKIVARLTRILNAMLGERALVRGQCPIQIDEYSEPEPDLSIVAFQIDEYEDQHPRPEEVYLLIEASDTTLQRDRKLKLPMYAEAAIPEVWILDMKNQIVEVYTNPENGKYQTLLKAQKGDKLQCTSLAFELEVERIFGRKYTK
jgi:Uma2 family endonuclease